jgi:glycosyltransferase involved in cell wall biosynthesis
VPTVSVCIPTYNGAKYLREAVASVLCQSFDDIEILVVDDCSSDGTIYIAHELLGHDPRARIVQNNSNLGLVGNWNRCVELAQGEYIKFLFQDDLLEPTCVERLVTAISLTDGFAFCERKFLIEPSADDELRECFAGHVASFADYFPNGGEITETAFAECSLKTEVRFNLAGEPSCALFRKSSYRELGGFSFYLSQFADWEYWMRIGTNWGARFVPEELCTFRVHGSSTTSKNRSLDDAVLPCDVIAMCRLIKTQPEFGKFRAHKRAESFCDRLMLSFVEMLSLTPESDLPEPFQRLLESDPELKANLQLWRRSSFRYRLEQFKTRLADRIAMLGSRTH